MYLEAPFVIEWHQEERRRVSGGYENEQKVEKV